MGTAPSSDNHVSSKRVGHSSCDARACPTTGDCSCDQGSKSSMPAIFSLGVPTGARGAAERNHRCPTRLEQNRCSRCALEPEPPPRDQTPEWPSPAGTLRFWSSGRNARCCVAAAGTAQRNFAGVLRGFPRRFAGLGRCGSSAICVYAPLRRPSRRAYFTRRSSPP